MRYRLIVPVHVDAQIDACIAYIVQTLCNPNAARSILDDLAAVYERLEHLPEARYAVIPAFAQRNIGRLPSRITTIFLFIALRKPSSTLSDSFICVKIIGTS